jgi:hypothetical protein
MGEIAEKRETVTNNVMRAAAVGTSDEPQPTGPVLVVSLVESVVDPENDRPPLYALIRCRSSGRGTRTFLVRSVGRLSAGDAWARASPLHCLTLAIRGSARDRAIRMDAHSRVCASCPERERRDFTLRPPPGR